ncbi:acyltransferase [Prosthecochloris sp. SCSIO W1101]|uniref:acyltransferase family protein n=1 Tax=Prosthecochloris sp. SCSIO W1101 TaxID=2992242 RepID=UPI00223E7548|nr:acyltransferase [Prosthecochloris sp. SCSIO W1101]UZJ41339.1 acyltransferase [Prosthecochloris sp. SCSIO W1101]
MASKPKERNIAVDTLRGIACIMLVAYHVIGATPESGLRLQEGLLVDTNTLLVYIRMPLFTFLSGIVYGWRPYTSDWKAFLAGKTRRLIVPMLAVGTTFAIFQVITPGTNADAIEWRYLHLKPVAHFWFLESLFLIFLVILPLEHFGILGKKSGLLLVFLIASIFYIANTGTPWFSISGAFYLFPYFLAGLYCTRFSPHLKYPRTTGYILLALIIIFLLLYGKEYGGPRRSFSALTIGTLSCFTLFLTKMRSEFLAFIGNYSYSIYLFHVFFTAASRITAMSTGIDDIWLLFILGTTLGTAGPILVEVVASRYDITRTLLLGKRPANRK